MVPIKEALTFDDVTLAPKYSEILPGPTHPSWRPVTILRSAKCPIGALFRTGVPGRPHFPDTLSQLDSRGGRVQG